MKMSQEGMTAALLASTTEAWRFSDDLMCEHKFETYESTCRLSDLVTRCRPQIAKLSFERHLIHGQQIL